MEKQKKKLGIFELTGYGVGNCIGSGIFVSMGMGIAFTGRSIPLALILASVVVLFAYAFRPLMAGMLVLPGGRYSQQALLQPPILVGVSAISNLLSGLAFSMFAMAIVEYAGTVFPQILPYSKWISALVVTIFFITTMFGAKFMAIFNLLMVVVLMISLTVFIGNGFSYVQPGIFALSSKGYFSGGFVGFMMAVACMAFACQGATIPIEMTADAKNPKKNLPIAILIATVVVAFFYCLVAIVAAGVLPVEEVANQNLGVVAKEIFPRPIFVIFILGGACFAIATSLYSYIASVQMPLLVTIDDGWLPAVLGRKTKSGYPLVMNIMLYAIAIVPIFLDMGLMELISFLTIPNMIMNMINNILFIPLVKKYPKAWENSFFHMSKPLLYITIGVSLLCGTLVTVALFTTIEAGSQIGMVVVIAVLFLYSFFRLKTGKVDFKSIEEAKKEAQENAARQE